MSEAAPLCAPNPVHGAQIPGLLNQVPAGNTRDSETNEDNESEMTEEAEDESGDEDEDEDETSSDISEGGDLREELEDAFSYDVEYKGNFYHSESHSVAPNPCLFIEGLGAVGLPLTPRDADLLIKNSSQAPFGQGTELVVNSHVRHTWEIEPARIRFLNTEWPRFIQNTVVPAVQTALGVTPNASQPSRCELYKLLLYEPGSHFLPHQDTEKAPGMFATIIIVLPSLFSGGQVHVSHGSKQHVIDIAANSMTATSILAWYTDVTHEVKPITEGYRLALSYNLIHTSHQVPRPAAPPTESYAYQELQRILRKWQEYRYDETPQDNWISYILQFQYSPASLRSGLRALKGQDAHLVGQLKTIADEFGFQIFLGSLKYTEKGSTDGDGGYDYSYHKRRRYCYYDEDSDEDNAENMTMDEVHTTSITVNNLVDINGVPLQGAGLDLAEDSLIPKDAFEDADPDGKEYDGYMGNYPGDLEQWYSRSVLLLVHEDSVNSVLASAGISYHVAKLSQSALNQPTDKDRQTANSIASRLKSHEREACTFMMNLSLQWKDVALWKTVVKNSGNAASVYNFETLAQALGIFGFAAVQLQFENMAKNIPRLKDRIEFLQKLSRLASAGVHPGMDSWCRQQYTLAVTALEVPKADDIPTILSIGKEKGLQYLITTFLPLVVKRLDFNFLVDFVQALFNSRANFSGNTASAAQYDEMLGSCLKLAIHQWDITVARPGYGHYGAYHHATPHGDKIQRAMKIVELCSEIGQINHVKPLFSLLLNMKGPRDTLFTSFYVPFIGRLRTFILQTGINLANPNPFSSFLRVLIETYLHHILGAPSSNHAVQIRRVGCGCMDCDGVDRFILNAASQHSQVFRMAKPRRLHVESRLAAARDLITYSVVTSGSPHGVYITKSAALIAVQTWSSKVSAAKSFLGAIGDSSMLQKLMGGRYEDVRCALQGLRAYKLDRGHREALGSLTNAPTSVTPSIPAAPSNGGSSGGQKRKQPCADAVNLGVIDLTED